MPDLPIEAAIERAREALSPGAEAPARAAYVRRLDRPGAGYYLVVFGPGEAVSGVAAVDGASGEVLSYATLSGAGPQLTRPEPAELVWKPCRASFSMLSPFWEARTPEGITWIDQQGRHWTKLDTGQGG